MSKKYKRQLTSLPSKRDKFTPADKKVTVILYAVAISAVVVDMVSKIVAEYLLDGKYIELLGGNLYLYLTYNPGAAFSILAGHTWVLTLLSLWLCSYIVSVSLKVISAKWAVCLGLLLGGAAGNMIDRIFRTPYLGQGKVVDFIGYGDFFIGNIADIFIVVAVVIMAVMTVLNVKCFEGSDD